MIKNLCNTLTSDSQSSIVDYIDLANTNTYQKKIYQNRYWFACNAIKKVLFLEPSLRTKPFRILDAATGTGAGAAYLSEQLVAMGVKVEVLGVDLDERAIALANEKYSKYARFLTKDIVDTVKTNHWDAIISMETIEHVSAAVMNDFLVSVAVKLNRSGVFVCSSPRCRPRESTVKRPGHINELYYQEFKYTLGGHFPCIEFASMDRYGNLLADSSDANLMLAACYVPPKTEIFS